MKTAESIYYCHIAYQHEHVIVNLVSTKKSLDYVYFIKHYWLARRISDPDGLDICVCHNKRTFSYAVGGSQQYKLKSNCAKLCGTTTGLMKMTTKRRVVILCIS